MATKTQTHTTTAPAAVVETVVETSTKVIALIKEQISASVTLISKKRATAEGVRAEADAKGYDKKQASQMVALCWIAAFGMQQAPEDKRQAFLLKSRPDISKVISLAYPAKETELKKAYAHNDKLPAAAPKQERIGENALLEIARGNATFSQTIAVKSHARKPAASGIDSVISPEERLTNAFNALFAQFKIGQKGKLTKEETTDIFNDAIEAFTKESSNKNGNTKAVAK